MVLNYWSGDYACFTRPEMKAERVSYDVITPSAAQGILEAIHWKPAIRWVVDRITVLNEIRLKTSAVMKLQGKSQPAISQQPCGAAALTCINMQQKRGSSVHL